MNLVILGVDPNPAPAPDPPDPSVIFESEIRGFWLRGGAITRAQVKGALDRLDAAQSVV